MTTLVEVDAIASSTLRELVSAAIERWIDPEALRLTRIAEESEKEILSRIVNNWDEQLSDSEDFA